MYHGKQAPFPALHATAVPATAEGPPGLDDELFQNLLSAEWVVFNLYQQAVEAFNQTAFVEAGYANDTYDLITQIRDNEAGHLRIFQNSISNTSVKPGPCEYEYGFGDSVETFFALQYTIEVTSMGFLTGFATQAQLDVNKEALLGIATVEARHTTWSLLEAYGASPFAGPSDTLYPYANQLLYIAANEFIVNASSTCPSINPVFPTPEQDLPVLVVANTTKSVQPGHTVTLEFNPEPILDNSKTYYVVFHHGILTKSVAFNITTRTVTVPEFEHRGMAFVVLADTLDAPTKQSVIAGPGVFLFKPKSISVFVAE